MPIVNFQMPQETEEDKATAGCNICPNCGEKEKIISHKHTDYVGNSGCLLYRKPRRANYIHYNCMSCGATWESERFSWKDGWFD